MFRTDSIIRPFPLLFAALLAAAAASADPWIVRPNPRMPEQAVLRAFGHPPVLARGRSAPLLLLDLPDRPPASRAFLWAEPLATVKAMDDEESGFGMGWITPVGRSGLDDPDLQGQSAFTQIHVAELQSVTDGAGGLVAVVDSGVDYDHPDPLYTGSLLGGWDYVDGDADATDTNGHGTRTSGVIVAVLPGVQILPLRVLNSSGVGTTLDVADAIEYATDEGAEVINLSLGATVDSQAIHDAVDYALAAGVNVVAAVGNDDTSTPYYPAAYSGVIAVAGVDASDVRADFVDPGDAWASNYGSYVDVSAPAIGVETTSLNDDYVAADGTSYACALVSATLAGARAAGKTKSQSETDLLATAVDVNAANPGYEGLLGDGRVDAAGTVQ